MSKTLCCNVLVLLVVVALAASVTTALSTSDNTQTAVTPTRLLRVHHVNKDDEERVNNVISPRLTQWLHSGESVDDVFKFLKLDNGVDTLLTNPNLNEFITYVGRFNLQHPGNGATAIKTVTATYGDDVVAKILQTAKKVSSTKVMAEKLLGEQRVVWLTSKQSPDDVFRLLKLNHAANNPLSNPNLDAWASYLELFNYVNPGKKTSMLKTFTATYGDDGLSKMLQIAKKDSNTKGLANKLQDEQRKIWLDNEQTPDDVFKLLKLNRADNNPLNNPNLDAWTSYLTLFNYNNPGKETTMIKTFTVAYGDDVLARILNEAKAVPETESIAKNLQLAQFTRWMRIGQNPDKVYINIFKLDPKVKTIAEPYQKILNEYHWFYRLHLRKKEPK